MSGTAADRNLLIGILALQMDFIHHQQLIHGMNAWVLDKSKPLAEILVTNGALAESDRHLLEPMVDRHVEIHDGDAGNSLAALSTTDGLRDDLRSIHDSELEASIGVLKPEQFEAGATVSWAVGEITSLGQRFRILRAHAKGGLGQVSVALDKELNREVALKEIQDSFANSADARGRFMLEAQITGGLEHPGIVPVYGLGQYDDGRPFYAMRFIRGDSLKEAVHRFHSDDRTGADSGRQLELRKLLGRFIDVCNAVEYAHSRGVLHRDLKPANIMLGKYGETLVVDWGLAKAVGRSPEQKPSQEPTLHPESTEGSAPTVMGSTLGTPEYMSPEQAEGRIDLFGPQTDVYSLGATLYALLTGRSPADGGDRQEVLRKVRAGEFPRPRETNPSIPRALESVCLKAMAREQEGRYGSPSALAEEVERWLADEPVQAYPEPWHDTARRWARRHRVIVAAAAVTLICLSIALAVGNVLVRNQRDRAEIARQEADDANQRAQQNAATTRQVLDHFLVQIGDDELSLIPQFEMVRVRMVEEAVRHYRELLRRNPEDDSLRSDVAMTLRRCANLYRMVSQFEKARELYEDSAAIMQDLVEQRTQNEAYRHRFIDLLRDQADLLLRVKGPVAAKPVYQEATDFARQCRQDLPDSVAMRKAEALLQNDYSEVLCSLGQYDQALPLARDAARTLTEFADIAPSDLVSQLLSIFAWNNLGRTEREAGKLDLAENALRQGVERGRANLELNQHEPNSRYTLAWALVERGLLESQPGQTENARASFEEAIEILELLTSESPRTASFHRKLAEALTARGRQLAADGELPDAINDARRAVELLDRLDQESGGAAIYKPLLMSAYALHGKAELEQGNTENARAALGKARRLSELARADNPQHGHLTAEADEIESLLKRVNR